VDLAFRLVSGGVWLLRLWVLVFGQAGVARCGAAGEVGRTVDWRYVSGGKGLGINLEGMSIRLQLSEFRLGIGDEETL